MRELVIEDLSMGGESIFTFDEVGVWNVEEFNHFYEYEVDEMYISDIEDLEVLMESENGERSFGDSYFAYVRDEN